MKEVPGTVVTRVADSLQDRGALFFRELVELAGEPERAVLAALWELVWAGTVTNDAWHPARGPPGRRPAD